jgi:plasmid stabilization system protein ParE
MSYRVEFADSARSDLEQIVDFIAWDNPPRAKAFAERLERRIRNKLSVAPRSGPVLKDEYRYAAFDNYIAVYRVEDGNRLVIALMISEGHRNWRSAFG